MAKYNDHELVTLMEYERKLLGKSNGSIPTLKSPNLPDSEKEKKALLILKYVFEDVFHWTPSDAEKYFNQEVIDKMCLNDVVKRITFPVEMDPDEKFYYYVWKVYPQHEKKDLKERALSVYRDCINGKRGKLPSGFFGDTYGTVRAYICLQEALSTTYAFTDFEDYYELMSKPEGMQFLNKMRLTDPCLNIFGDPVSYLHETLGENQNAFHYQYYYYQYYERRKIARKKAGSYFQTA